MKISIIIPVYNAEKYLQRCLDSILKQGLRDIEIICVDDGSTDSSLKILREYEMKYDNCYVLTQKNCYAGVARNYGLTIAKGEYIHFLDADDYVMEDAYEEIYKFATENNLDYVKVRSVPIDINLNVVIKNNSYTLESFSMDIFGKTIRFEDCPEIFIESTPAPWSGFVKRNFILENGIRFNKLKCVNDRSFYANVISHAKRMAVFDEYLVCHYVNNKNSLVGIRSENFECHFKSYNLVRDIVKDISEFSKKIILGAELNDLAVWYNRLNDVQRKKYDEGIREFFSNIELEEINKYFLLTVEVQELFQSLEVSISEVTNYMLNDLDMLKNYWLKTPKFAVYGAGKVCCELLRYMQQKGCELDNISYIIVSHKGGNPDNILGVPVRTKDEVIGEKIDDVLIATLENTHLPIFRGLALTSSCKINAISNSLYEEIRLKNFNCTI